MAQFFLLPVTQWLDNSGAPLNAGTINFYQAGTTTAQDTYTDSTGGTPNANPVVLDSAGRAQIWLSANSYKFVVKTSGGATLLTVDNFNPVNVNTTVTQMITTGVLTMQQSTAATSGANQSSNAFKIQGTYWDGAVSQTDTWQLQDVLGTGSNPTSTLTLTHSGSTGTSTADVSSIGLKAAPYNLNGRTYVDGIKYALSATGIQAAINDAVSNGTFEVWLPPQDINISTTLTISNGPFRLIGGSGGDFNNGLTASITRLKYTGAAGSDLLQISGSNPTRPTGIQLSNLMLDGAGIARYALRMVQTDVTSFMNMKIANAVTANWYLGDCTGISVFNVSCTEINNGASGLVLDSTNTFFAKGMAFEDLGGSTTPGVYIWSGGGVNHSNSFTDIQMDVLATSPVGFVKLTGYDGASPWAGAPASVSAGAARQHNFYNLAFAYATAGQSPASQGGDILIDGTAANPVSNVNFFGGEFDGATITLGAQVGAKIDHASNVRFYGVQSRGHTAGSASTFTTTANSSSIFSIWVDQGTDTNLYSGATTPIVFTPTNFKIDKDGNIALGGQTPFAGTPATIVGPQSWALAANGVTNSLIRSDGWQFLKPVTLYNNIATADFGLTPIQGTPQHLTAQVGNVGATNLLAAAPAGTYKVHFNARTTTSGTGTTGTVSITWTDEGGAKTFTSATWALNSVTVTGQVNGVVVIHSAAGQNIQVSTSVTIGTSAYALDAWVEREN